MPHDHAHDHAVHHHHHHAPVRYGRAFAIGMALNLGYVVAEAAYGVAAHSLALLADAGHNLSDVLGLGAAWLAASLVRRRPSARFTYGLGGSSILAALGNAVLLLVVTGGIAWEAVRRLMAPEPSAGLTIIVVAAIGVAVNGVAAWLFASGRKGDLNIHGAFLHMAADALVSVGVVVAGALILLTGWQWLDPATSLVVSVVIVAGTWSLLRDSLHLSLAAVPPGVDEAAVHRYLAALPDVGEVHDLHIWALSTTETALTAHLVLTERDHGEDLLRQLPHELRTRFSIGHCTIQLETGSLADECALRPDHVI